MNQRLRLYKRLKKMVDTDNMVGARVVIKEITERYGHVPAIFEAQYGVTANRDDVFLRNALDKAHYFFDGIGS